MFLLQYKRSPNNDFTNKQKHAKWMARTIEILFRYIFDDYFF